ncbi:hypothetical protein [uncultured Friedmanniella sp.]|uniref:hypothetical protein n=1 Tax=uncultured Friedmanniella sp. TaxID=335381 RepID=UPI0035CA858E
MSVDVATDRPAELREVPVTEPAPRQLVRQPHPALADQQAFAEASARVLRRAEAAGERLVIALYLVLSQHRAVVRYDPAGPHLSCAECRPVGRLPREQYPCPTAQQAFWALDAVLR